VSGGASRVRRSRELPALLLDAALVARAGGVAVAAAGVQAAVAPLAGRDRAVALAEVDQRGVAAVVVPATAGADLDAIFVVEEAVGFSVGPVGAAQRPSRDCTD